METRCNLYSPSSFNEFLNMDLWNNSLIRVGNKPVNYKSWIHKGINKVKQITENNLFLGYTDFLALYNIKTSFIEYYGITTALSKIRKSINQQQPIDDQDIENEWYEKIATCDKVSRTIYTTLVATVQTKPDKSQAKWITDCNVREIDSSTWQKIYIKPFSYTKSSKLRNFQFKFDHRRIATNSFLKQIRITEDDLCTFCKSDKETLYHLLWSCPISQNIWRALNAWFISCGLLNKNEEINQLLAVGFNTESCSILLDLCSLITRYFLYTCKLQQTLPQLSAVIKIIHHHARLEKQTLSSKDFLNKWKPLTALTTA